MCIYIYLPSWHLQKVLGCAHLPDFMLFLLFFFSFYIISLLDFEVNDSWLKFVVIFFYVVNCDFRCAFGVVAVMKVFLKFNFIFHGVHFQKTIIVLYIFSNFWQVSVSFSTQESTIKSLLVLLVCIYKKKYFIALFMFSCSIKLELHKSF